MFKSFTFSVTELSSKNSIYLDYSIKLFIIVDRPLSDIKYFNLLKILYYNREM